jgi:hypothetical protein
VDAANGFAHPAIDAGWPELIAAGQEIGGTFPSHLNALFHSIALQAVRACPDRAAATHVFGPRRRGFGSMLP